VAAGLGVGETGVDLLDRVTQPLLDELEGVGRVEADVLDQLFQGLGLLLLLCLGRVILRGHGHHYIRYRAREEMPDKGSEPPGGRREEA
jgi:hypothetical protein